MLTKININGAKNDTPFLHPSIQEVYIMPKPRSDSGQKNLISKRLVELRKINNLSQRDLAHKLQLMGYDIDKNVITRIETNHRFVTDLELLALTRVFDVTYDYLIEGKESTTDNNEDKA